MAVTKKTSKKVEKKEWGLLDSYGYFSGPFTKTALINTLVDKTTRGYRTGRVVRLTTVKTMVTPAKVSIVDGKGKSTVATIKPTKSNY